MRRGLLAAYAVVAAANVAGQLVDTEVVDRVTKPLLVPLLVALLLTAGRPATRLARAALLGLVFCWLGDLALMGGDDWFLVGLMGFLAGQVAYCTAFATTWSRNPIRERRALAAPYVAWWVLLLVVLGPDLGGLVVPVAVYGAVLCSMAALALGVHRLTALGAVAFDFTIDGAMALLRMDNKRGYVSASPDQVAMILLAGPGIPCGPADRPLTLVDLSLVQSCIEAHLTGGANIALEESRL